MFILAWPYRRFAVQLPDRQPAFRLSSFQGLKMSYTDLGQQVVTAVWKNTDHWHLKWYVCYCRIYFDLYCQRCQLVKTTLFPRSAALINTRQSNYTHTLLTQYMVASTWIGEHQQRESTALSRLHFALIIILIFTLAVQWWWHIHMFSGVIKSGPQKLTRICSWQERSCIWNSVENECIRSNVLLMWSNYRTHITARAKVFGSRYIRPLLCCDSSYSNAFTITTVNTVHAQPPSLIYSSNHSSIY